MIVRSKIKKALVAVALGAGVMATAVPAQAGSLESGLLAGLIGGVALGALAASAQAEQQGRPVFYSAVPAELGAPEDLDEIRPLRHRRGEGQQRRVSAQRRSAGVRASAEVTRCAEVLEARARPLGAVDVTVSSAGSEVRGRDGGILLPVNARIEYARKGQRQVRQARVGCRVNTEGQVVELR